MTKQPTTNTESELRKLLIVAFGQLFIRQEANVGNLVDKAMPLIAQHTADAVKAAQLESDRVVFKLLHKFTDELLKDHDNFSGKDNSSMIIGRYAMKIKDAVNAALQARNTQ